MAVQVPQQKITQAIDALRWAVSGDDAEAAAEARKRAGSARPIASHFFVTW